MTWQLILTMISPWLTTAGHVYISKDENNTGLDDAIGQTLVWLPSLFAALIEGHDLPKAPPALR